MAEWIKYLNETERGDLFVIDQQIAIWKADRRRLMNRAKQRRLRERRENNLPPR